MTTRIIAQGAADCGGACWFDLMDSATGDIRRVFLWLPPGPPPENGWPGLWLLDGNAVINTAIDVMRAQASWPKGTDIGWGVLIAIGYPTDDAYDSFRRSWDLGPPPGKNYPPFHEGGPEVRTGGGAEMARFLLEDVREFLTDHVRLNPKQQSLFGHSFGGLFTLWLLFTRPDAFRNWIAASPAITWENSFLLQHMEGFQPSGRELTVYLSAGEWEGDELAPFQRNQADASERLAKKQQTRTVAAAQDMAASLTRLGLHAEFEIYPDETHMSVLPVAVNRAVRYAFSISRDVPRLSG